MGAKNFHLQIPFLSGPNLENYEKIDLFEQKHFFALEWHIDRSFCATRGGWGCGGRAVNRIVDSAGIATSNHLDGLSPAFHKGVTTEYLFRLPLKAS